MGPLISVSTVTGIVGWALAEGTGYPRSLAIVFIALGGLAVCLISKWRDSRKR